MDNNESFENLVENICCRPKMFVCGGTFYEVCAYLSGYAHASPDCLLGGEGWRAFNDFVCASFRFPNKYGWPYVIHTCCPDDDEATERLRVLLSEFAERTKKESYDDIIQDVYLRASDLGEGEPEKAWRKFSRAIHRGRRDEIEPLIQEHADADVLWAASYPDSVIPLMDQIDESYHVSQIAGSEEKGEVTIISPDFGPVGVKLIDGSWRIDASKIIECWKVSRG